MRDYRLRGILFCGLVLSCALMSTSAGRIAQAVRSDIEPGIVAVVKNGRELGIEISPPRGSKAQRFIQKHLLNEKEWRAYANRGRVFIPISRLKLETQRATLLAIYSGDTMGPEGWTHTVLDERETLWSLCAWLTSTGQNYRKVMAHPKNGLTITPLHKGQKIFFPRHLLTAVMQSPAAPTVRTATVLTEETPAGLRYAQDEDGPYASYTIKKGEAIYTSVVGRFTDYRSGRAKKDASSAIARRSGITNVRNIDSGTEIRIPLAMLSNEFKPGSMATPTSRRETVAHVTPVRGASQRSRDLTDVVIILDPGHGGGDHGASYAPAGLYEDEINYDIVVRIRKILLEETGARVYLTMTDSSSGLTPVERSRFSVDRDEALTTDPPYENTNSKVSVNLRWMLVNSIYEEELKRGTDPRKVVFTSVHTDSLSNDKLRGAMIYYPAARLRRPEEVRRESVYKAFVEGRQSYRFAASLQERQSDEAASKLFANILYTELGNNNIKRHDKSDAIRSEIRKSRRSVWVPGVLRNNKVPTKVLVETANIENARDREWLAAPWWRQKFARAYVNALKSHFDSGNHLKIAMVK